MFFKPFVLNSLSFNSLCFLGGFDEKILFSVFDDLVSGKLGVNSSGNLLKSTSLYRGVKLEIKRGRMVSNTSYLFKKIKPNFNKMGFTTK
ncbi:hypothetical protein F7215_06600 [Helicobacter pylori]|nr:hypothetical protein [Helicobacter pylori]